MERSKSDRRCRCALYQEMVSLFNTFYHLNEKNVNEKEPIDLPLYCMSVKVSVIGFEFRDKLLRRFKLPELLGHSNQPELGQTLPKQTSANSYAEISNYINQFNIERKELVASIARELSNVNILKRRCAELIEAEKQRELDVLGKKVDLQDASISEDSDSDSETSTNMSMSEVGDDIFSQQSAKMSVTSKNAAILEGIGTGISPNVRRTPFAAVAKLSDHFSGAATMLLPSDEDTLKEVATRSSAYGRQRNMTVKSPLANTCLDTITEAVSALKDARRQNRQ